MTLTETITFQIEKMGKESTVIILGTAHLATTPGKCSPDGQFREYAYSREIVAAVAGTLRKEGYTVFVDYMAPNPSPQMKGATWKQEQSRELAWRVDFVNSICAKYGKEKCIYVSVHNNAAGADGCWHTARGFSVYVSPKASEASKVLARCINDAAKAQGQAVTGNRAVQPQGYWTSSLYVLNNTRCQAVLTENLFQDNREDVAFLLSPSGREAIARLHVRGIVEYIKSRG